MVFGVYLVEKGAITPDQHYEALQRQLRTRPQLGKLAVQRRLLTVPQVFSVLEEQCQSPGELFGNIAVRLGYFSGDELASLLHEQSMRMASIETVLVEAGMLGRAEVDRHLREFHADMERTLSAEPLLFEA